MTDKLIIESFSGKATASTIEEVETELQKRDKRDANCFWLCSEDTQYPSMNILVKDNLAYIHFWQTEKEAGYRSATEGLDLNPDDRTVFYLSENGEDELIWNDMILPYEKAIEVAKQFFLIREIPDGIEWEEL